VAENLARAGVFVFDVNTTSSYRVSFAGESCFETRDWLFVWRGEGDRSFRSGQTAAVTIEAFGREGDGRWIRSSTRHVQRHHGRGTLRRLLRRAGLACEHVYGLSREGELSRDPRESVHSKFVYVARHAAASDQLERG
jgi:hypothetical protein